jgi:hypothetical protein
MPLWRAYDPLPILAYRRREDEKQKHDAENENAHQDAELEVLFEASRTVNEKE